MSRAIKAGGNDKRFGIHYPFLPAYGFLIENNTNIVHILTSVRVIVISRNHNLKATINSLKNISELEPFYAIVLNYISDMIKTDRDTGLTTYIDLVSKDGTIYDLMYSDPVKFDVDLEPFSRFKNICDLITFIYLKTGSAITTAYAMKAILKRY